VWPERRLILTSMCITPQAQESSGHDAYVGLTAIKARSIFFRRILTSRSAINALHAIRRTKSDLDIFTYLDFATNDRKDQFFTSLTCRATERLPGLLATTPSESLACGSRILRRPEHARRSQHMDERRNVNAYQ
jgi:hypothetical protein